MFYEFTRFVYNRCQSQLFYSLKIINSTVRLSNGNRGKGAIRVFEAYDLCEIEPNPIENTRCNSVSGSKTRTCLMKSRVFFNTKKKSSIRKNTVL